MKRTLLITLCCIIAVFFTIQAYSADGPYLSANLGLAALSDSDATDSTAPGETIELSYDTGWTLGAAVGYRFNNLRVEGELSYQKNDLDQVSAMGVSLDGTGDASGTALLVNGYYVFANESAFTPYIRVGQGNAKVEANDYAVNGVDIGSEDDSGFAYQAGVGVGYAVNENVTIDIKYRYFATVDAEFDTAEVEIASHNFLVGVRYNF